MHRSRKTADQLSAVSYVHVSIFISFLFSLHLVSFHILNKYTDIAIHFRIKWIWRFFCTATHTCTSCILYMFIVYIHFMYIVYISSYICMTCMLRLKIWLWHCHKPWRLFLPMNQMKNVYSCRQQWGMYAEYAEKQQWKLTSCFELSLTQGIQSYFIFEKLSYGLKVWPIGGASAFKVLTSNLGKRTMELSPINVPTFHSFATHRNTNLGLKWGNLID